MHLYIDGVDVTNVVDQQTMDSGTGALLIGSAAGGLYLNRDASRSGIRRTSAPPMSTTGPGMVTARKVPSYTLDEIRQFFDTYKEYDDGSTAAPTTSTTGTSRSR